MIAVDTNILVYAHRADSPWHVRSADLLRSLAEGTAPWAIPWQCIHEFLAVVTNGRIYRTPTPIAEAVRQVEYWLESPTLTVLGERGTHWPTLKGLLEAALVNGALVHDARVAALCLQHGATTLWTADRDFSRFRELRAINPLVTN
jgi:toxin-antitoxin system PIN domain toxin